MKIEDVRENMGQRVLLVDPIENILKFDFGDEFIVIDGTGDQNIVHGNDVEADCSLIMTYETYLKLREKELKPMIGFMTGKIKVKGDVMVAKKLKSIM